MRQIKIIVEERADGYVAYPLGLKGVVVGEGDTYEGVYDRLGAEPGRSRRMEFTV